MRSASPNRWKCTTSRSRRNLIGSRTSGSSARRQDVVVGLAGLLLGREVLVEVGKGVAGDLELGGREGVARGGLRVDARGVVDKVGVEAAALDLFGRHAAGELVDDRGNHLDVGKLFGARIIYMTMEDA